MKCILIDAKNPKWSDAEKTCIEVEAKWQHLESEGYLPFGADPNDVEAHGVDLFNRCVAEEFGTVADYVEKTDAEKWIDIRSQRNQLLEETDWMAHSDNTLTDEMKTYRQQLRDLPTSQSNPDDVVFPEKPTE